LQTFTKKFVTEHRLTTISATIKTTINNKATTQTSQQHSLWQSMVASDLLLLDVGLAAVAAAEAIGGWADITGNKADAASTTAHTESNITRRTPKTAQFIFLSSLTSRKS
jgi:hypothetical protein